MFFLFTERWSYEEIEKNNTRVVFGTICICANSTG